MANIKIIDDDVEAMETLAEILATEGHVVTMLHDTDDAVSKLKESAPDLIVLDVMFPGNPSAGMELAISISREESLSSIPVIMLTAVNDNFPMQFSDKDIDPNWLPVAQFIEKPVDAQELLQIVADRVSKDS